MGIVTWTGHVLASPQLILLFIKFSQVRIIQLKVGNGLR
jgi:hypothetical protein